MIMTFAAKKVNPAKLSAELLVASGVEKTFAYEGQRTNKKLAGMIWTDFTDTHIIINETEFEPWVDVVTVDQDFQDAVTAVLVAHTP